jgi:hypothetical protein
MPTQYKRKGIKPRCLWSQDQLVEAANAVRTQEMGVNEAARSFNIPAPTLRRRLKSNNLTKIGLGGGTCVLGLENENKIKRHVLKLQKKRFRSYEIFSQKNGISVGGDIGN